VELAGITVEVRAESSRTRTNDVARAVANSARAHALLNWAPSVAWSQTLSDVLEDWRRRVVSDEACAQGL
jgi:nucleoside-diphosphate-sugar epimerase